MKLVILVFWVDAQLSFKPHINSVVAEAHNYQSRTNNSLLLKPWYWNVGQSFCCLRSLVIGTPVLHSYLVSSLVDVIEHVEYVERAFTKKQEATLTLRGQRGRCRNIEGEPQIFGSFPSPRLRLLFLWVCPMFLLRVPACVRRTDGQTDGQTDGRTDGIAVGITALYIARNAAAL